MKLAGLSLSDVRGFADKRFEFASDAAAKPHDLVLVTGPAASGKTRFLEATGKFSATHVKVVTDRGVVYLMGLVRRSEIDAAAQIASTTKGVERVVKVVEYID